MYNWENYILLYYTVFYPILTCRDLFQNSVQDGLVRYSISKVGSDCPRRGKSLTTDNEETL